MEKKSIARGVYALILTALTTAIAPSQEKRIGRVEGRVLGPLGQPMVGVSVWAAAWPTVDNVVARSRTDGEGMYVLNRLPMGSLAIFATAPGHTVARGSARLSAARRVAGERLRLWPATTLKGRVVDAAGQPVAGAHVLGTKDFTWFDGGFETPQVRTNAKGEFELPGVPIGDQVIRAWAPGYRVEEHPIFSVEDTNVEVRLKRGAGVRIRLTTTGIDAAHLPAVRISIYPTRNGSGFRFLKAIERGGRLGDDGGWSIAGLPNCEWNVQLSSPDYAFDPRMVRSKKLDPVRRLQFKATRIGRLKLTGVLRTPAGQPLAGEQILCRTRRSASINGGTPGRCTTNAKGEFTLIAPLSPGEPYSLQLVDSRHVLAQEKKRGHTGYSDTRYLVRYEDKADADRKLELVAKPAVFLTAEVRDPNDQPAAFRWCELQVNTGSFRAMAYATSTKSGKVTFPGVHAVGDPLRIEVSRAVGAAYSSVFRLDAKTPLPNIVVKVPLEGSVRGRVVDHKGRARPGVRLMMQNYHMSTGAQIDGSWTNVMTNRNGEFAFVGVAPTGHKIHVDDEKGDTVMTTELFEVKPGKETRVDIRVAR